MGGSDGSGRFALKIGDWISGRVGEVGIRNGRGWKGQLSGLDGGRVGRVGELCIRDRTSRCVGRVGENCNDSRRLGGWIDWTGWITGLYELDRLDYEVRRSDYEVGQVGWRVRQWGWTGWITCQSFLNSPNWRCLT